MATQDRLRSYSRQVDLLHSFSYHSTAQEVFFGTGFLDELPAIIAQHNWQRLMLCSTRHLQENGVIARIENACPGKLVAAYNEVKPHVPDYQVEEVLTLVEGYRVDAVIGLGGGSAIGMAKAVSLAYEAKHAGPAEHGGSQAQPQIPVIAIPTTYAGSEMTPIYGVTRKQADGSKAKVTVRDPRVPPRVVIYDPELTVSLPPDMTAATGINALAHCIEAVYSPTRNALSTSAALQGIKYIKQSLVRCHQDGNDLQARYSMQLGAHLAGSSLATVSMGLHHGTGHVLGGMAGVPHGVASCIVLPHAIRFNASAVASHLALAAEAMNIQRSGLDDQATAIALADHVSAIIRQLGMPQRLRDVGVQKTLLPRLAENMLKSTAVRNNPKPVTSTGQILPYLEAMW